MALEGGSLKLSVGMASPPPKALEEDPSMPLPASGDSWCPLACGCIAPVSASAPTCFPPLPVSCPLLIGTLAVGVRAQLKSTMISS